MVFVEDFDAIAHLLKRGRFRKLHSYLWSRLVVRDVGGGLLDPLYRRFPRSKGTPKEVEIEITTRCGLRCVMCEHTHWDEREYAKLDIRFDDLVRIVEGFDGLRFCGIQGMGTPFLNPDFSRIVRFLDARGITISMVENFNRVSDEHMEVIVEHVDRIDLSIDAASKALYEKLRPGSNFDHVVANVRRCRDLKLARGTPFPQFFVRIVAFRENVHEVPRIVQLVKELDLNLGHRVDVEVAGLLTFEKITDLMIDADVRAPEHVIGAAEEIARGSPIKLSWNRTGGMRPIDHCAKWVQPFITVNGDAVMDCANMMSDRRLWLHENTLGNAIETPYREIWRSDAYQRARESVNDPCAPISKWCRDCRAYDTRARQARCGLIGGEEQGPVGARSRAAIEMLR